MPNCKLVQDANDPMLKTCPKEKGGCGCGRVVRSHAPAEKIKATCGKAVAGPTLATAITLEPKPKPAPGATPPRKPCPCAGKKARDLTAGRTCEKKRRDLKAGRSP